MAKQLKNAAVVVAVLVAVHLVALSQALESPQYTVVHTESEFEIRYYKDSVWMSAQVDIIPTFPEATESGFRRLFRYIEGANLNKSKIPMTKPLLTSIVPGPEPIYFVRLSMPRQFQASPPVPLPELKLKTHSLPGHCVAIRKFPGWAKDENIPVEVAKLATSLEHSPWANSTAIERQHAHSIAQYTSPMKIVDRINEVWIDLVGSEADQCKSKVKTTICKLCS